MNAIRLLFAAMVAALFTACASSYTDTGYRQSVYVDYEAIRAHDIEVTNGEVPNGRTAIGKLMEVRQFPKTAMTHTATTRGLSISLGAISTTTRACCPTSSPTR